MNKWLICKVVQFSKLEGWIPPPPFLTIVFRGLFNTVKQFNQST